ncbi:hypothetical protein ACS0TY_006595 [Phlomoides rotata]
MLGGVRRCSVTSGNSLLIEALALCFGVLSAIERGLQIELLESDSESLVHALGGVSAPGKDHLFQLVFHLVFHYIQYMPRVN